MLDCHGTNGHTGRLSPFALIDEVHDFSAIHGGHKPWKDIFGVGQGVGRIDRITPLADQVITESRTARGNSGD